ncbi:hypothetical protein PFISCL1PPCAC_21069, partial [Pristionchus fissidentatus]
MAEPESPLEIVEGWRRKIHESSQESNDVLLPVITKTFESISLILDSDPDLKRIQRALVSLELERNLSMEDDEESINGLIQCLHLTLQELTKIKD